MRHHGQLRGRVGVITGAESDVAQAIARSLASEGMSLMLIARPGCQVRGLAEYLAEAHDVRCFPASLDVSDRDAVDRIVMHAEQHVGTVDLLVNTVAGRMSEALAPTMVQRGRGHIVNIEPAPPATTLQPVEVTNLAADPTSAAAAVLRLLTS